MSRRQGFIGSVKRPVGEIPEPNRHIPHITAEMRVYFPPNAEWGDISDAILDAFLDARRQVLVHLGEHPPKPANEFPRMPPSGNVFWTDDKPHELTCQSVDDLPCNCWYSHFGMNDDPTT